MNLHRDSYTLLPNGLAVPRRPWPYDRPIAVDLFCGAGGFSLGCIQAGFHVLAGLDNDANAALTYLINLGEYGNLQIHCAAPEDRERLEKAIEREWARHGRRRGACVDMAPYVAGSGWRSHNPGYPGVRHFFFGDVRRWSGAEMLRLMGLERGQIDCVMGSPPCQGFSLAGRRNVMDPRNSLVFEFVRLVLEIYPRTMIFENVPGLLSMTTPEGLPVVDAMCLALERGGFGTHEALKKSLCQTAGAGAAVRSRGVKRRAEDAKGVEEPAVQATLPNFWEDKEPR